MRSHLNACKSVAYACEGPNNRKYLPDRRILVVIVKEKYAVIKVVSLFMDVRVSEEEEQFGLDATQHGEKAFHVWARRAA